MFKVEPGPGIRHDTPCRTSPVPEPFKCQAAKIGPALAGQAFGSLGPRAEGPTLNTLTLVGAPPISKCSKLRAPAWAGTPTLNTLNLVGDPPISKFSKLRAPAWAGTPTLNTLNLVGAPPISKCSKLRAPACAGTPTLNTLNLVGAPPISKCFKVASAGLGRHTNFEHFAHGRGSTNFKVFQSCPRFSKLYGCLGSGHRMAAKKNNPLKIY